MEIRRCIGCMEDMGAAGNYCPYCGYDNSGNATGHPCAMHPNTILHGRYLVGRMLGQGGFAITYIGFDLVLNVKVAVKEYFPMGAAAREARSNTLRWNSANNAEQRQGAYESFLREARKTAKIDQIPSIVRVRDTFYENETAYIVMDYVEGVTLKEKLKREGLMSFPACVKLLTPMMEGLAKVHETGLIHRDISPDNIMVQPDGSVKLLDLGAARDMSVNQGPQSQLVTKNGFSPLEQYTQAGQIGPWTDIYALCATIYYCITGRMLPSALDRMNSPELNFSLPTGIPMGKSLSASAEAALKAGLEVDSRNRIRDVRELLSRLNGAVPENKSDKATGRKKYERASGEGYAPCGETGNIQCQYFKLRRIRDNSGRIRVLHRGRQRTVSLRPECGRQYLLPGRCGAGLRFRVIYYAWTGQQCILSDDGSYHEFCLQNG